MIKRQELERSLKKAFYYSTAIFSSLLTNALFGLPSYSLTLQKLGDQTPTGFSNFSGITYSGSGNTYYGISDDPDGKFYTITIDVSGNAFNSVTKTATTTLKDSVGDALTNTDAEGIAILGNNLFVSTEGSYTALNPLQFDNSTLTGDLFIRSFQIATGDPNLGSDLALVNRYTNSTSTNGLRNNLAFESLTISPTQDRLFSAVEAPLKEDQTLASLLSGTAKSLLRILQFDLPSGNASAEYLYETEVGFGLADLLAVDNNKLIALERRANPINGAVTGIGVFEISLMGATDISSNTGLTASGTSGITKVQKTAITFDIPLSQTTNFEGLTFGEILADGRTTIFFTSDNNMDEAATTIFTGYAVTPVPFDFSPTGGLLTLGVIAGARHIRKKIKAKSKSEL
ncbi:MAG: hypothetical protein DCE90_11675 [Pseudanabaena sp.]|nr:MAG: hypothetical protein DCE90_11675 [Pseudanabaena sp.]